MAEECEQVPLELALALARFRGPGYVPRRTRGRQPM